MRRTIAAAPLALAFALLVASSSAAYAVSYLDEAVQALQTGNVYVSVETQTIDAATKERLQQQTQGTDIGVVILPEGARTEAGDLPQFANRIAFESNKETVVIAIGNDLEATGGAASKLANDLERSSSSTGEALVEFVTEVGSSQPASPPQDGAEPDLSGIGITVGLIAAVVSIGVALVARRYLRRKPQIHPAQRQEAINIPESIRKLLQEIDTFEINDSLMRDHLRQATTDTQELFRRLTRKKSNEIHQTTAKYEAMLTTVRNMLVTYVDVQANPRYYPNTETLLLNGRGAAAQYAAGVLKNIQEVERGSLTDFNVDIKMLANAHQPDDPFIQ